MCDDASAAQLCEKFSKWNNVRIYEFTKPLQQNTKAQINNFNPTVISLFIRCLPLIIGERKLGYLNIKIVA
jgi:hypothetical protein